MSGEHRCLGLIEGKSVCWDGRFLWIVSPDSDAHLLGRWPARERFLAVIDPTTRQITKFTAADGLPPMKDPFGAAAVTAIGPGEVLVAGSFGRSWCAIATYHSEKRKVLDVFFEAREIRQPGHEQQWNDKSVAFPIEFICTLNAPSTGGRPAAQRVLLGRGKNFLRIDSPFPLIIDPAKRSVNVLSHSLGPYNFCCVHEGAIYWLGQDDTRKYRRFPPLYRTGFPDFQPEVVGTKAPQGRCIVYDHHVLVFNAFDKPIWSIAYSFQGPFSTLPCDTSFRKERACHGIGFALSHHYGLIVWGIDGLYSAELLFSKQPKRP